jgi:hypothetical protein
MATFAVAVVLCLALPDRAVDEEAALDAEDEEQDAGTGTQLGAAA